MYPYIMKNLCVGLNQPTWVTYIEDLESFCSKYPCFIKVRVTCSIDMKFPLIALKDPLTNKVVQATGDFVVTV